MGREAVVVLTAGVGLGQDPEAGRALVRECDAAEVTALGYSIGGNDTSMQAVIFPASAIGAGGDAPPVLADWVSASSESPPQPVAETASASAATPAEIHLPGRTIPLLLLDAAGVLAYVPSGPNPGAAGSVFNVAAVFRRSRSGASGGAAVATFRSSCASVPSSLGGLDEIGELEAAC